jgi:hypothetical protein
MTQPTELKTELPVSLSNGARSTTTKVWDILSASNKGDIDRVKELAAAFEELTYAQYNYTPPIHFAVRAPGKTMWQPVTVSSMPC